MKSFTLFLCLFITSQSFAANSLTRSEEFNILNELEYICGDTWCGGDFNFAFNEIKCDFESKSCELLFEYINEVYNYETDELIKEERVEVTCNLTGIENYNGIISNTRNRGTLVDSFYYDVTDCFSDNLAIAYDTFDLDY